MSHYYELTIVIRTEDSVAVDAFNAAVDRVAQDLDAEVVHRFTEIPPSDAPGILREG